MSAALKDYLSTQSLLSPIGLTARQPLLCWAAGLSAGAVAESRLKEVGQLVVAWRRARPDGPRPLTASSPPSSDDEDEGEVNDSGTVCVCLCVDREGHKLEGEVGRSAGGPGGRARARAG